MFPVDGMQHTESLRDTASAVVATRKPRTSSKVKDFTTRSDCRFPQTRLLSHARKRLDGNFVHGRALTIFEVEMTRRGKQSWSGWSDYVRATQIKNVVKSKKKQHIFKGTFLMESVLREFLPTGRARTWN